MAIAVLTLGASTGRSSFPASRFWMADLHVHSAVSGDALQDLGILTAFAKSKGYNAIFLTDHTATSVHEIGGVIANDVTFDDDLLQWGGTATDDSRAFHTAGTVSADQGGMAGPPAPVLSGTKSLHMNVSSPSYGEEFVDYRRGPNLRNPEIDLQFSVYPTRIDPGSGAYVSFAFGGDPTIPNRPPNGYTTQAGVISPGKTTILVWQVGTPRTPSSDPNARVITHDLPYTLNAWNTYTVNVKTGATTWNGATVPGAGNGLGDIPPADMPVDYEGITQLKMAVGASNGGTADAYFDAYSLSVPKSMWESSGSLFVYRNSLLPQYDTSNFQIFPSHEMGYSDHSNDFDYGITDPAQFQVFTHGTDGIATAEAKGYPAQLNHPGLPGGVTQQEAIDNDAYGADLIEAAERGEDGFIKDVMVNTWDGILKKGVMIVGTWTSDAHRTEKFGPATYVWAPALTFDSLMRSIYEGRVFLANNDFPGTVLLNPADETVNGPYPARYPIYVPSDTSLVDLHLQITGGIPPGAHIIWTENGTQVLTESPGGSSVDETRSFPFTGPFTYVRAELRDSTDRRLAMTEPIFFRAASLPAGVNARVEGVTTTTGNGYTHLMVQGLGQPTWDSAAQTLTMPLANPAGALDELEAHTGSYDVGGVVADGAPVPQVATQSSFDAAAGPAWYYSSRAHLLRVKAVQGAGTSNVVATFTATGDTSPPTAPGNFTARATGTGTAALRWTASTDNVGVRGYTVYRDGAAIANLGPSLSFTDQGLTADHIYSYEVDAVDAAGNRSAHAGPIKVKTYTRATFTFPAAADTYVDETRPTTNFGNSVAVRLDGSPLARAFLRFSVGSVTGTFQSASVQLTARSDGTGFDVHPVPNPNWDEHAVTWNNQPAFESTPVGSAGGFSTGDTVSADATSLYAGPGLLSVALTSDAASAESLTSREGGAAPVFVVQTEQPNRAPTAGTVSLNAATAATTPWKPVVGDPDGDQLTCRIYSQPPNGSATVASDCSGGTYRSKSGYTGSDAFRYAVSDGVLQTVATVRVTVG